MQDLSTLLASATTLLAAIMTTLWVRAFWALEFGRLLPALRWLAAANALAGTATWLVAARPTHHALAAVSLLCAALFAAVQAISKQPLRKPHLRVGQHASDFSARRGDGSLFRLSSMRGKRVLLKLYRGHWCPYCRRELHAWSQMQPELVTRSIHFVAISPDTPEEVARFERDHRHYDMQWLSDEDLTVTDLYNLRSHKTLALGRGRSKARPLAIPTTVLIDECGIVRWIDQSPDHQVRSDPHRVLPALDAALAGTPGCEEANLSPGPDSDAYDATALPCEPCAG